MSGKLPADFDADRYLESYPDVALSGLAPAEHYLRFGKLMGRNPRGRPASLGGQPDRKGAQAKEHPAKPNAIKTKAVSIKPARWEAIIEAPGDLALDRVLPEAVPARANCAADGAVSLEMLAADISPTASGDVRSPLVACARLLSLPMPVELPRPSGEICGDSIFRNGATRLERAWFAEVSTLRLRIAGGTQSPSQYEGWVLRGYQPDPESPASLKVTGEGIRLPALGPIFHDLKLAYPLMPVLLELTDSDGLVQGIGLLPFPSLLPGGLHAAEMKVLQAQANPMDAFWTMSELLLRELLGENDAPVRSIGRLTFVEAQAGSTMSNNAPLKQWLSTVMGFKPVPSIAPPRKKSADKLPSGEGWSMEIELGAGPAHLILAPDCIPSISGLASRRLQFSSKSRRSVPFLVAEARTFQPRWSVVLPADFQPGASVPSIETSVASNSRAERPPATPIHLAVAFRPQAAPAMLDQAKATDRRIPCGLKLTVLLEAADAARTEAAVGALRSVTSGGELELLVRGAEDAPGVGAALDKDGGKWSAVGADVDLSRIAATAAQPLLLTISDRAVVDAHCIAVLCGMMADGAVGSASCALVSESVIKKRTVLQPAAGGLFPAGVSFASSPVLTFGEPDVLQALAELTYPVIANTFLLTAWRTSALAGLPSPFGPEPSSVAEIRLGLALIDAGFRNLCTTLVSAKFAGPYARRDAIDPIGQAYLSPHRWEDILGKVTVLRELF